MKTATQARTRMARRLGWLGVASMLAVAMVAPGTTNAAAPTSLTGAIWTSLSNGSSVNANLYDAKEDVYLNGGPQNCGKSGGLPDGDYYFQVSIPSAGTLLSTDAVKFRQIQVVSGVIAGVSGAGNHMEGTGGCNGGIPVRLFPYDDTTNNGGEYSVDIARLADVQACAGFNAETPFNFVSCTNGKNDNFKVKLQSAPAIAIAKSVDKAEVPAGGGAVVYTYVVANAGNVALSNVSVTDDKCSPVTYVSGDANADTTLGLTEVWTFTCSANITETTLNTATAHGWYIETEVTAQDTALVTVLPATSSSSTSSSSTSTSSTSTLTTSASTTTSRTTTTTGVQTVLAATNVPATTLPPTDAIGAAQGPSTDSWRIVLISMAALLAGALVLTPSVGTAKRRR